EEEGIEPPPKLMRFRLEPRSSHTFAVRYAPTAVTGPDGQVETLVLGVTGSMVRLPITVVGVAALPAVARDPRTLFVRKTLITPKLQPVRPPNNGQRNGSFAAAAAGGQQRRRSAGMLPEFDPLLDRPGTDWGNRDRTGAMVSAGGARERD